MKTSILDSIHKASQIIGNTWPLHTFVASNPLSGYENAPFTTAVAKAQEYFNANAYPSATMYRQAWERGAIDKNLLHILLSQNGLPETPENYLALLEKQTPRKILNTTNKVDRLMTKWLSCFMDEGLAEWEMPYKSEGFYTAWRLTVVYDSCLGTMSLKEIPKTSEIALQQALEPYNESEYTQIFSEHLAALPGWTGYINHRVQTNTNWQQEYPINLMDYLAVRLWTFKKLQLPLFSEKEKTTTNPLIAKLQHLWLQAWEESWQNNLVATLKSNTTSANKVTTTNVTEAQMVFCIDTRSEHIRKHVELSGDYETFGYAGFFGIAMDYESLKDGIVRKSCPPIVTSGYLVSEKAPVNKNEAFNKLKKNNETKNFTSYFLGRMKNMLPSAFGYVEGSGVYYGLSMIVRTFTPNIFYKKETRQTTLETAACDPSINTITTKDSGLQDIPLEEKVTIVKGAFNLMGWRQFAPLVVFVGHGSHSANNPFSSSLDCGACAASPGRHNARMLAKMANCPQVRAILQREHHIEIPQETIFIGAEHNTTTDAIVLFDAVVPLTHKEKIEQLKANLEKAQKSATTNRLHSVANSVAKAEKKASDWAETRPEWGLAKNAGFIVAPRAITKNIDLDSRCFLHSYNWQLDPTGKFLEGIMQGPMVVTQWINNHYYFATVDNEVYGGGSKITHNITGRFGVVQGNGGDIKTGLPLQSVFQCDTNMYHEPLRLTVLIQAPISRVSTILTENKSLRTLLDNEWIYLMVMDPEQEDSIFKYEKGIKWQIVSGQKMFKTEKSLETVEAVLA